MFAALIALGGCGPGSVGVQRPLTYTNEYDSVVLVGDPQYKYGNTEIAAEGKTETLWSGGSAMFSQKVYVGTSRKFVPSLPASRETSPTP